MVGAVDVPPLLLDAEGNLVVRNERLEELPGIGRAEIEGVERIGEVVYDGGARFGFEFTGVERAAGSGRRRPSPQNPANLSRR